MGKGIYRARKGIQKTSNKQNQKHASKKRRMIDEQDKFNKHVVLKGHYD